MPANKKYLSSGWHQVAKLTAGLVGGLVITSMIFAVLSYWLPNYKAVVVTSIYGFFPVWLTLFFVPYLFKNGWKCWLLYLLIVLALYLLIILGKTYHPIHLNQ